MISLSIKALQPEIRGATIHSSSSLSKHQTTINALADTGCQSCLAGTNLLRKLNLKTSDLIPVKTKMKSASNEGIRILGALLLNLSGSDAQGRIFSSNQMTYITDSSDSFFLSRSACADLGIIPETFPTIGEAFTANGETTSALSHNPSVITPPAAPCGCPQRSTPPPLPHPPVALTDNNRVQLQNFLLDYYASSTFNVCPHQTLPHMSGPPMKLMVDPNATPVAHHKAFPVPLHFKKRVKEDLD